MFEDAIERMAGGVFKDDVKARLRVMIGVVDLRDVLVAKLDQVGDAFAVSGL